MLPRASESVCERISLLGVKIDPISLELLLSNIHQWIESNHRSIISYVNVHAMNIAFVTPWFREFLNQSDITFCDGVGIKLAAKWTGQKLQYRYTPPDFMEKICEMANHYGWKLFFLGAKPGTAEHAAKKMRKKFPSLQIEYEHGYFDKMTDSQENQLILKKINQYQPHILIVGFGMPLQEKWILENVNSLDVKIAFPAGALFDYLSGELPRAPRWITDYGLEWFGRLVVEPRRLWKRYIIGNPLFFWRIFIHHYLRHPLPR